MTLLVSAGVIWRPDGKLLLTRRPEDTHLGGMWEFPGGKVEPNEDPSVALVRECREECAIEVSVLRIADVAFHRYANMCVLLLFYDAHLTPFLNEDPVQHLGVSDHRWATPDELVDVPLPPPDIPLVRKLIKRGPPPVLDRPPHHG